MALPFETPLDQESLFEDEGGSGDAPLNLEEITELARELMRADMAVEKLEQQLEAAKRHRDYIAKHEIPEAMGDLTKFSLKGGYEIELKPWLSCKDSPAAQDWLVANGRGSVIKDIVSIAFDRGEHDIAADLLKQLVHDGYETAEERMSIHYQTLCAELRRMIREGVSFPREVFQMEEGEIAKIKHPK